MTAIVSWERRAELVLEEAYAERRREEKAAANERASGVCTGCGHKGVWHEFLSTGHCKEPGCSCDLLTLADETRSRAMDHLNVRARIDYRELKSPAEWTARR